ncbi:MAG TPA: glycoside hydrolase family 3 N-terminal domain-containing protein [bacterium]|nr:glycoside hydrolase family 3 N-terminal domain-containing protein [bacterium]
MEERWLKKKVEELLEKMTLEEKIAQLGSIQSGKLVENGKFSREKAQELLKNGIGQITRVAGYAEREPEESVEIINEIQKFLKEETRLGIPAIIHEECLSGVMTKGATTFPQAIGMASTFEPSYIEKMTSIIRKEMRAFGVHQGLSPVLDIPRDPRWGRTEETFGEDPYLVSKMAESYINGLQGDDWKDGIIATAKHFTAYGISEGGRNLGPARVSERELREVFLFPFEVAVRSAKVGSIMNAYHEIDGIPCASSRFLLTKILREEWDFKGFVVSDYHAIDMLHTFHKVANSLKTAAIKALEAGIEIELPEIKCYGEPLFEAVREGLISMSVIDTAVARVLRAKILLGLMDDNIYADPVKINSILDSPEHRMFARELARKSMVLLKNDSVLPLKKDIKSIAIIGPSADVTKNLHGDYSYTAHIAGVKDGVKTVTVLEGIKNKVSPETTVYHATGCDLAGESREGFKEAVDIANKSEVIIAVMGENSGLFKRGLSGEGNDRTDINLPGVQEELLKALKETGKPIVLVLLNGRPLSIKWEKENVDAIIEAWYPGEEGGNAIADVIFGDYNPAGRLPISFPTEIGQMPVYYNRKPSAFNEYLTTNTEPLFPFGHGLSYTTFEYSDLIITPEKISSGGYVDISFKLKNTGSIAGEEVVQLYIHDEWASVERPIKELKGFIRVYLEAGEEKEVTFRLFTDQLAFYDEDMRFIVEAGIFEVMVGASSEDIRLTGKFEVTETRVITKYRKFASEVTIR